MYPLHSLYQWLKWFLKRNPLLLIPYGTLADIQKNTYETTSLSLVQMLKPFVTWRKSKNAWGASKVVSFFFIRPLLCWLKVSLSLSLFLFLSYSPIVIVYHTSRHSTFTHKLHNGHTNTHTNSHAGLKTTSYLL